jgi:hypothetical protein
MKFSSTLATVGSALLAAVNAAAASSNAHVFLLDSPSQNAAPPAKHHATIDPATARLIFAERLSLSDFYDVPSNANDDILQTLNAFSGAPSQFLLGGNKRDHHSRILIVVDGVANAIGNASTRSKLDTGL